MSKKTHLEGNVVEGDAFVLRDANGKLRVLLAIASSGRLGLTLLEADGETPVYSIP